MISNDVVKRATDSALHFYRTCKRPDMDDEAKVKGALIKYQMSLDASALPLQTTGEAVATVVWHDPVLDILPPKAGKIIDASIAFIEAAPLGTKLYTSARISVETVEQIVEKHCNAYLEDQERTLEDTVRAAVLDSILPTTRTPVGWTSTQQIDVMKSGLSHASMWLEETAVWNVPLYTDDAEGEK